MPNVRAVILIREYLLASPHNKTPKGPVALADFKLATAGIVQLVEAPDFDFTVRFSHF